jgi:ornithine carbamoyltransferase
LKEKVLTTFAAPAATPVMNPPEPASERDLISIQDFTPAEIKHVIDLARAMKANPANFRGALAGKQMVLFFEKPSLRTRLTFESAIASLGGTSFFVDQTASRLGARESLSDMARNIERWVDVIVLRTFSHATITDMAAYASIPVINALSDHEHPCQALADFLTLKEKFGDLSKVRLAYVGDGNNVAHSLMLTAASVGATISVGTPAGYEPDAKVTTAAKTIAAKTGGSVQVVTDPIAAVSGADAVYTDVWASMGQESEAAARSSIFAPYQVNSALMGHAASHAIFMHCLPAHRGDEATADVIDSSSSVVFDEAENRLHIQKAILYMLLGGGAFHFRARSSNE